jgi:DNA polymerase-3 subunit beta
MSARNHALPILQTIRIEGTNDGHIDIRATNLELGVIIRIEAEVVEPGVIAVPASTLLQTITLIHTPRVTLSTKNDVLVLESHNGRSEIKTLPPNDFPTIAHHTEGGVDVDAKQFSLGIQSVGFAASQSSIKPELGAVYIHQRKPHTLTFVATDSFRLAERTIPSASFVPPHPILVPARNALEIARIIDSVGESPKVVIADNQIAFSFPSGAYVVSRTIEGNFPDYEQIIPKEYQVYATALTKEVEHALRSVNVFANKFMQVALDAKPSTNSLIFRSENADYGRAEETTRIDGNGSDIALSFNQHYLMEGVSHIETESIDLSLAGIGRPLVMKPHETDSFRYLVMPMNK